MSSAHLKSPPSSLADSASSFDASFTSPVYKVVVLPGASYSSPHSKLVLCRPNPPRRKVARRDVTRQLQFPLSGTDSDASFDDESIFSLERANNGPPTSCSDFTEEELRSLPMYARLPIKLEDLWSDDESETGMKNAATIISHGEELARTHSVLLQPNSAVRELQPRLSEALSATATAHRYQTILKAALNKARENVCTRVIHTKTLISRTVARFSGGKTNKKTSVCPGGVEEKYPKQNKVTSISFDVHYSDFG